MGRVKSLLAPGGILILCETTDYLSWFDVTTGLIEGWQRFEDGLRDEHPLLSSEVWSSLLQEAGFEHVAAFPEAESPAAILGQRVFVARVAASKTSLRNSPAIAVHSHGSRRGEAQPGAVDLTALTQLAPKQRHENLVELVRRQIAEMLRFDSPERVERKRRLTDLGLDSLMAIELSGRLTRALQPDRPLSSTLVFDYPTLDAVADYLQREVLRLGPAAEAIDATADMMAARAGELEQLEDDEVEAILLKKLQAL